jgi:hypothetical protein
MAYKHAGLFSVALMVVLPVSAGQKFKVVIVNRQNSETNYSYVVSGHSTATTTANANCYGTGNTASCSGSSTTNQLSVPPHEVSYNVSGATFSLQLADGRIAVVNCEGKLNWNDWSHANQVRRNCRIPLVNEVEAEFDGDKAKLKWSVSIDGKKMESETYKIIGIIDKQN